MGDYLDAKLHNRWTRRAGKNDITDGLDEMVKKTPTHGLDELIKTT